MTLESMVCQKCRATGSVEVVPKLRHYSLLAWLAGGIIFSMLWSGSRKTDYHCTMCDARYSQRTVGGWICLALFWIGLFLIAVRLLTLDYDT